MKSVFVNEITAEWLEQELPEVAQALIERGAAHASGSAAEQIAQARAEGVASERARLAAIEAAAFPGQEELVARLIAEGATLEDAKDALIADEKSKRSAALSGIRKDEAALTPPTPGSGSEPGPAEGAAQITALAEKAGVIPKRA